MECLLRTLSDCILVMLLVSSSIIKLSFGLALFSFLVTVGLGGFEMDWKLGEPGF
jgi:hypothetical protein